MKNQLLTNLFVILLLCVICQNGLISQVSQQWVRYYNSPTNGSDNAKAIFIDNNGNIYVTGTSWSNITNNDFATVKYNSSGVQQWVARFDSENRNDDVRGITVDTNGNVYVTGVTSISGSSVIQFTIKYNSSGIQQWAAQLGIPTSPAFPGISKSPIAVDNSGNVYVGGYRRFGGGDNGGYLLIKYNSNGDSLWTKRYKGTQSLQGLGSTITCIKLDENFVYATGVSYDAPNICYATTLKYNSSGILNWIRKDTLQQGGLVVGIEMDASKNILLACNKGLDIVTLKYDPSGARLWKTIYTGISGDFYDKVTGIDLDPSGNVYLSGYSTRGTTTSTQDCLTLKYDANGNQLWERLYNGALSSGDEGKGITVDESGNAYVTGFSLETGFRLDYLTIKYNSDGVQQWMINYNGGNNENDDVATAIALDQDDNIIVTGNSSISGGSIDYGTIKYSQTVGINQISSQIPNEYSLSQNYPNPFNPVTNFEFEIPASQGESKLGLVALKIYDMLGKEVATLVNANLNPGTYKYNFDASGLTSGIYFYRIAIHSDKLETEIYSATKKMLLVK